ncbi:hypothetical protein [Mycolicibacterium sp. 624]|uniref:hypothetical protein n=1 Tax=Mycolicibacterium sp. 624 TaxID=3156314 RepID=UPI00339257ED
MGAIAVEELAGQVRGWYRWVREQHDAGVDIELRVATRRAEGAIQTVPTHVSVPTNEAAA